LFASVCARTLNGVTRFTRALPRPHSLLPPLSVLVLALVLLVLVLVVVVLVLAVGVLGMCCLLVVNTTPSPMHGLGESSVVGSGTQQLNACADTVSRARWIFFEFEFEKTKKKMSHLYLSHSLSCSPGRSTASPACPALR
jgi:hypothetical protein